jgi:hypothetical protein
MQPVEAPSPCKKTWITGTSPVMTAFAWKKLDCFAALAMTMGQEAAIL